MASNFIRAWSTTKEKENARSDADKEMDRVLESCMLSSLAVADEDKHRWSTGLRGCTGFPTGVSRLSSGKQALL